MPSKESRSARKHPDDNPQPTQDMDISPGDSTPTSEVSYGPPPASEHATMGPVLLANALPRLISHPIHLPSCSPQSTASAPSTPGGAMGRLGGPDGGPDKNSHSAVHSNSLSVDTNHSVTVAEGPPTPTHSETPDCAKGEWFSLLGDVVG